MTTATLLWSVLFGSVGMGYCVYGKKQRAVVPLLCGLLLIAVPYLVGNSFALEGEMTLAGGALSEAKFSRVQLNRGASARATITRSGNRYRVAVDGGALDARAIIKRYMSPGKSSGEGGDGGTPDVTRNDL